MTKPTKFTDTSIAALQARETKYTVAVPHCPGLSVKVTPNGVKTLQFSYRNKAQRKVIFLTYGRYPEAKLADACEWANKSRAIARLGGTPLAPHKEAQKEFEASIPYAAVVERYRDEKLVKLRSCQRVYNVLCKVGRDYGWNDRPIGSITDEEAQAMLHDIAVTQGKGPMANQTKHLCQTMFTWAQGVGRKWVTVNPFVLLERPGGENEQCKTKLNPDEIKQVWAALDTPEQFNVSVDVAAALRTVLVTACRPGMAAGMTGAELRDLRGPSEYGPHWELSGARMKNGNPFATPLTSLALDVLRPHLKDDDTKLFDIGPNEMHEAAAKIVKGLKMKTVWTPHDLRRTASSLLGGKFSLEFIGKMLAHDKKTVTGGYVVYNDFPLKQTMAAEIERRLRDILGLQKPQLQAVA